MTNYMAMLYEDPSIEAEIKLGFITKAMDALATVAKRDLPPQGKDEYGEDYFVGFHLTTDPIDGVEYDLRPKAIKALGQQPIYELRLSVEFLNWYFRATFFPKYHPVNGQLYHCIVHPFDKVDDGRGDPTDDYMDETYRVFDNLKWNFNQYSKYFDDHYQ